MTFPIDAKTLIEQLVAYLEPLRGKCQPNKIPFSQSSYSGYGPLLDWGTRIGGPMTITNTVQWSNLINSVLHTMFRGLDMPVHSGTYAYQRYAVVFDDLHRFVGEKVLPMLPQDIRNNCQIIPSVFPISPEEQTSVSIFHNKITPTLSRMTIPVRSRIELVELFISLETKYSYNISYIENYKALIPVIEEEERNKKEENEREKQKQEEDRIRKEQEKIRKELEEKEAKERKRIEKERLKKEQEDHAFEEEVQRRLAKELYEQRVNAEVQRRLAAMSASKAEDGINKVFEEWKGFPFFKDMASLLKP